MHFRGHYLTAIYFQSMASMENFDCFLSDKFTIISSNCFYFALDVSCCEDETGLPVVYCNYHKLQFSNSDFLSAVDKIWIGLDRIGSD